MAERNPRTGTYPGAKAETLKDEAREAGHSAADIMRAGRDEAVDEAKTMMRDAAEKQRARAADGLGGMAKALHQSARDMEKENATMARYTDIAAQRLDEAARYIRQADWGQMRREAESFARRQPYWFIGGALAAGFVAARLVKGSGAMEDMGASGVTGHGGTAYSPATNTGYGAATTTSAYGTTAAGTATTAGRSGDLT